MSGNEITSLEDLALDPANANAGTERGTWQLEESLKRFGAGRSVVVDKHGIVIAGNGAVEVGTELGLGAKVIHTDGRDMVVVVRDDLDLATDKKARELAIADNRVGAVRLRFDEELLVQQLEELDLDAFWTPEEIAKLGSEVEPPSGFKEVDENLETQFCCPKCGYEWSGKQA